MRRRIYHFSKRILIFTLGVPVIAVGIALIPLPGPGFVVIAAGLAILSLEFDWARRWLEHVRRYIEKMAEQAQRVITQDIDKIEKKRPPKDKR